MTDDLFDHDTRRQAETNWRERAEIVLENVTVSCASCGGRRDNPVLFAGGNPFLSRDRFLLAYHCPVCGSWSVLRADLFLRKPLSWEEVEIKRSGWLNAKSRAWHAARVERERGAND
jgi:hypothetical protein